MQTEDINRREFQFYAVTEDGAQLRATGDGVVDISVPIPEVLMPFQDGFVESLERLELAVDAPAGDTHFHSVYRGMAFGPADGPSYGMSMRADLLPTWLLAYLPVREPKPEVGIEHAYVNMKSRKAPEVGRGPADALSLMHQLAMLDARNVGHDQLFKGQRLRLHLKGFWYSPPRSIASMLSRHHPVADDGRLFKLIVDRVELPNLPEAPPTVADLVSAGFEAAVRRVIAGSEERARTRR